MQTGLCHDMATPGSMGLSNSPGIGRAPVKACNAQQQKPFEYIYI